MRPTIVGIGLGGVFACACSGGVAGGPSGGEGGARAEAGAAGGDSGASEDASGSRGLPDATRSEDGAGLDAMTPDAGASDAEATGPCARLLDDARPESQWVYI